MISSAPVSTVCRRCIVADLGADVNVLKSAQDEAQRLLKDDPALTKPEHRALRERIDHLFSANSDSFN